MESGSIVTVVSAILTVVSVFLGAKYRKWLDMKRDILRRTILELLTKGNVHYTELDKKVCATYYSFATPNTFKPQLQYLLYNGFIERISRGVYKITNKGENYLLILKSI